MNRKYKLEKVKEKRNSRDLDLEERILLKHTLNNCLGVDYIHLAQDRFQCRADVNTTKKCQN
jgi:hypothetical protein